MKHVRTWILIADGARARVLQYLGPGRGVAAVEEHVYHADHNATHDLVRDREGRSYSSHSPRRSAIEAHSDPHRELKSKFAQRLADMLAAEVDQKSFERLVIVAPPVTLGDLRSLIDERVKAKIIGEVAQDLTKLPNDEVPSHLKDVLVI